MKTILVVDDSDVLRDQLTTLLRKFGYEAMEAADGKDALRVLEGSPHVDLAVVDIVMPILNGRELIRRLRDSEAYHDLPILVLTAAENLDMVTDCLDAGADDFLIKPLNPRLMFQRVQGLIENTPRAYNRVPCHVVAEVSPGARTLTGVITELGEGGVGLLLDEEVERGDLVKISFSLPGQQDILSLGAEVVYVKDAEEGILHGLRFVIIDRETRARIMNFVQESV